MQPAPFPVRSGCEEDFARARDFLRAARFDEPHVCAALKLDHIGELIEPPRDGIYLDALPDCLRWAVRVFVRGETASEPESRAACGDAVLASFRALGLLHVAGQAKTLVSPVWLYPIGGFLIASDRHRDPAGRRIVQSADAVFAACFEGTLHFLRLLPDARNGDALDLCGGTGIGALHLSRTARHATTADVTPRAAHFAAFNARLNGSRVESLCGDVYAPVGARQFDLITCHPPYLPAGGAASISRDGGETGEEVTRRTVAGLARHLRPGGLCVVAALGCDRADAPFETRARGWLGVSQDDFDVAFGVLHARGIDDVVQGIGRREPGGDDSETAMHAARLRMLGVTQFVYGVLLIRRCEGAGARTTRRAPLDPAAGADALLALLGLSRR